MSFSLNIFVPPDEPVVPAPSSKPESIPVGSSPVSTLDHSKKNQSTARSHDKVKSKSTSLNTKREEQKHVEATVKGNSSMSPIASVAKPMQEVKENSVSGKDAKDKSSVITISGSATKQEESSEQESDEEKKHSRKNPEYRPRQRAPLSLIRQIRNAPTEEAPSEASSHLFELHKTFNSLGLFPDLASHVTASVEEKGMGLQTPTNVQSMAIPALVKGRDALVKSETGSGKTLAFVLPMLHSLLTGEDGKLHRISREDGTYAIVLSPTRELCLQIYDVLVAASKPFHWIISTAIVGGEKKKSEKARLRKGVNIIVATPGRLADHLRTTYSLNDSLKANPLRWLILDEADRLLDTGFEKQVQEILDTLQRQREEGGHVGEDASKTQTVLLSATITSAVEKLAGLCLHDPVRVDGSKKLTKKQEEREEEKVEDDGTPKEPRIITVDHGDSGEMDKDGNISFVTPKQLVQHYLLVESGDRLVALAAYLRRHIRRTGNTCKTLVFVSSRACAEFYHAILSGVVWPPSSAADQTKMESAKGKKKGDEEDEVPSNVEGLGTKWYVLHGSVDQKDRKKTLKDFASVRGGVLICTDVAARGLDLPQVDLVVQFDPPSEVSEYVHRVGRTARSGRRGAAVIFLREAEAQYLEVLKSHGISPSPVKMTFESLIPPPQVDERTGKRIKAHHDPDLDLHDAENCKIKLQRVFEEMVTKDEKLQELARNGYLSWVGAYSVHSAEIKHIFITRELHFGHVARSFALKDPPTKIKQHQDDSAKKKKKRDGKDNAEGEKSSSSKSPNNKKRGSGGPDGTKKRLKKFDPKSEFEA